MFVSYLGVLLIPLIVACNSPAPIPIPQPPTDGTTKGEPKTELVTRQLMVKDEIVSLKKTCLENKGASWDDNWMFCHCSQENELFVASKGCTKISLSQIGMACLNNEPQSRPELVNCIEFGVELKNLVIYTESLNQAELKNLWAQIKNENFSWLNGMQIPQRKGLISVYNIHDPQFYKKPLLHNYEDTLKEVYQFYSSIPTTTLIVENLCRLAIPSLNNSIKNLCADISQAVTFLATYQNELETGKNFIDTTFTTRGENCIPDCRIQRHVMVPQQQLTIKQEIEMSRYVPIFRTISVYHEYFGLVFLFNANGELAGGYVDFQVLNDSKVQYRQRWFGIENLFDELSIGQFDSQKIQDALKEMENPEAKFTALDGPENALLTPIRGLLFDSNFNYADAALLRRMQFEPAEIANLSSALSNVMSSLFSGSFSIPVNDSDHASSMVSVITKDLPNAKIGYIQAAHYHHGPVEPVKFEKWSQQVSQYQPRVVNISQGLETLYPNCNQIFYKVFGANPNTLFVVSAGNTGSRNPDSCPGKLAASGIFKNTITVAGIAGETLHRYSSYGTKTAQIAAPFSMNAIEFGKIKNAGGTSFSAAFISNQALKYFAKYPDKNPETFMQDLKNKFCQKGNFETSWQCAVKGEISL